MFASSSIYRSHASGSLFVPSLGSQPLFPPLIRSIGGEAESYQGVKVTYVPGKTAILTIYEDGREKEKIVMHELKDRPAMHALMKEKGFKLKSSDTTERRAEEERADALVEKRTEEIAVQNSLLRTKPTEEEDRNQSLRHSVLTDLHKKREEEGSAAALLRRREKEQLLAMAGPRGSTMFYLSLAGGAATVGLSIIGLMSRKSKKNRRGLRK